MGDQIRQKWNVRYRESGHAPEPARVLAENLHLLTPGGTALDLACGLGANARLLARRGLETWAWDVSDVAIAELRREADGEGLIVYAEQRDVEHDPPEAGRFDAIVVAHFLARSLAPAITAALRPGGLLFYQTFIREAVEGAGPSNPEFRLAPNELLALFRPLRVVVYREEGTIGDTAQGFRNEAMYVGRKLLRDQ